MNDIKILEFDYSKLPYDILKKYNKLKCVDGSMRKDEYWNDNKHYKRILIAKLNDALIAQCTIVKVPSSNHDFRIGVYVKKEFRKKGIAKLLVDNQFVFLDKYRKTFVEKELKVLVDTYNFREYTNLANKNKLIPVDWEKISDSFDE